MSDPVKRFRVAFSFAGEKRPFVAELAAILAARFGEAAILYDKYHQAEFARRRLGIYLPKLYHEQSDLIVVVVCPDYDKKEWPGLEWDAIYDLLKKRRDDEVMLLRFALAEVEGVYSSAGFLDLDDQTPEFAATCILERLALNEGKPKDHYLSSARAPVNNSSNAPRIAVSKLFRGRNQGSELLVGRDADLAVLDNAWSGDGKKNVVTIVAWAGVGKTSLVAHWATTALARESRGSAGYYDWSFYTGGTRREGDAGGDGNIGSADVFVKEALEFFGDPELAASNVGAWKKGERLAQLVGEQRTLLILDGLEPLQDAKSGELRDEAICALLRGLAAHNLGLCIVTTRKSVPELNRWYGTTAREQELARLTNEAGAKLLKELGVKGTHFEYEQLASDVKGHALTLTLLGKYLVEAHRGDIRKRDLVSLTQADYEETSGHAFRVIEAYERWLERDGRRVELALLRLLGLFDRPAPPDCLAALRQAPVIVGLTEGIVTLTDQQWNLAVKRLDRLGLAEEQPSEPRRVVGFSEEEAKEFWNAAKEGRALPMIQPQTFSAASSPSISSIDAHPLVREYFRRRVREKMEEAWKVANSRLLDHLRASVPYWPEGLNGLLSLYQAVAHGCQAGRFHETLYEVYIPRILRGTSPADFYSISKLGVMGADLAAVGCFFDERWTGPTPALGEAAQAWLLHEAAFRLRALGRLTEAREPMRAAMEFRVSQENWKHAAISLSNLSDLDLLLGDLASAVSEAKQGVDFADRSGDAFQRIANREVHAAVLHQAGLEADARSIFIAADAMQRERQPHYPFLYSVGGFHFADFLLSHTERHVWRVVLEQSDLSMFADLPPRVSTARSLGPTEDDDALELGLLRTVEQRAKETLTLGTLFSVLLDIALDHLTLGRVALYHAILEPSLSGIQDSGFASHVDAAVHSTGQSNMDYLPGCLLTRAWLRALQGQAAEARADLDEAQQIAARGPMPLHLADVYLHRARLFFRDDLDAAREDLRKARELIFKHGYLRR